MSELLENIGHNIRRLRDEKGWNQTELGFRADTSPSIISLIENGKRNPSTATLAKIAGALGVEVVDLFPKGTRRLSPELSLFGGLEDERRARWDADVQEARQLRKTARTQMQRALKAWRESKDRGEPHTTRRKHLDEMGALLQKAYDAQAAVGRAYMQAALKQSSDAPLPRYLQDESRAATDFYIDLWRLVQDAGLGIRTNGERTESEKRPTRIEEEAA